MLHAGRLPKEMSFYVYILHCSDGSYYVGHTEDLEARLYAHQTGMLPGYTRKRRPVRLVWCDDFPSRDDAFQRERQLKGWSREKKEALIRGDWQRIQALAALRSTDRSPESGFDSAHSAHPSSTSG
jgi:predicted GIY-YIG superfamily endonuclease